MIGAGLVHACVCGPKLIHPKQGCLEKGSAFMCYRCMQHSGFATCIIVSVIMYWALIDHKVAYCASIKHLGAKRQQAFIIFDSLLLRYQYLVMLIYASNNNCYNEAL